MRRANGHRVLLLALSAVGAVWSCTEPVEPDSPLPVHSITVSPDTLRITPYTDGRFTVTLRDSLNRVLSPLSRDIVWTLEDVVGTVTLFDTSSVYISSTGSATVRATSEGKSGTAHVVAAFPVYPPYVAVFPDSLRLNPGDSVRIWITIWRPGYPYSTSAWADTWTSGDTTVATVTDSGDVRALRSGTVELTARYEGVAGKGTVVVQAPATSWAAFGGISAGDGHSCGVALSNSAAVCWPPGGAIYDPTRLAEVDTIAGGHAFTSVSAAEHDMCGIRTDSTAVCSLGGPGVVAAVAAVAAAQRWVSISVSPSHRCALAADSTAWCWGSNVYGQFGVTDPTSSAVPVEVGGGHQWLSISAGMLYTCGVRADSTAMCWGRGDHGSLGGGTLDSRAVPDTVSGAPFAASIATAERHACLLTAAGAAWCWGRNTEGQLGDGSDTDRLSAVPVVGVPPFLSISPAYYETCGLAVGGAVWCWGTGAGGPPAPVASPVTFVTLSGSGVHHCALAADGSAWCWGWGGGGELGDGTLLSRSTPVRVRTDH